MVKLHFYNQQYSYNQVFEHIKFEDGGGVEFAIVKKGESSLDEVFLLGYYYGAKIKELRDQNKIDW